MAGGKDGNRPLIIKKVIGKGGGGHHGGAWKVAYADFVTAMMAFFLLMWLLGATTEDKRKGIADFFSGMAASKTQSGAGGVLGGTTIAVPGPLASASSPMVIIQTPREAPRMPMTAEVEEDARVVQASQGRDEDARNEAQAQVQARAEREQAEFKATEQAIRDAVHNNPELQGLEKNLMIDQTPEGMRIQIVDLDGQSMFPRGGVQMYEPMRKLLKLVVRAIGPLPNKVSVRGHTDASPFTNDTEGNWGLSTRRAEASLRTLIEGGLDRRQVKHVMGMAETEPLVPENPLDPRNRRITILLLREYPAPAGMKG